VKKGEVDDHFIEQSGGGSVNLEQLRMELINLTALHYRTLLGEDALALSGEIPTMDDVKREIARIEPALLRRERNEAGQKPIRRRT
jgi:hypothetical protein